MHASNTSVRRGNRRPVDYVKNPDTGEPVEGLRLHKSSGRCYRIEDNSRCYYRPNGLKGVAYLRRAVFEHLCWLSGRDPDETETLIVTKPAFDMFGQQVGTIGTLSADGQAINITHIHPDDIAAYVREQLQHPDTRFELADRTGIPELARLDRLRPSELSMSLSDVGDLYFVKRKKPLSESTRRDGLRYWNEFCDLLSVNLVSEINGQHIRNYYDTIYDRFNNGMSPSYVKARFATIKTVLNHALKRQQDVENIQQVLVCCKMLEPPPARSPAPQPIERAHYRKLLEVANTKWRAILLLALNAAFYPIDVCRALSTDIKPDKHGLAEDRPKTGVPRVAWLWDRTLEAVTEYQAEEPHEQESLFVSTTRTPYKRANQVTKYFHKLRQLAKVPATVQFAHLRDGAASHSGPDVKQTQMLLGHRIGEIDKYKLRDPSKVKEACEALENHYFGGQ
jgi:integrase